MFHTEGNLSAPTHPTIMTGRHVPGGIKKRSGPPTTRGIQVAGRPQQPSTKAGSLTRLANQLEACLTPRSAGLNRFVSSPSSWFRARLSTRRLTPTGCANTLSQQCRRPQSLALFGLSGPSPPAGITRVAANQHRAGSAFPLLHNSALGLVAIPTRVSSSAPGSRHIRCRHVARRGAGSPPIRDSLPLSALATNRQANSALQQPGAVVAGTCSPTSTTRKARANPPLRSGRARC